MTPDWRRWPNFSEAEMRCRCGRADMDPAFMDWLQQIRDVFAKPMIVSSGYRCADHNARVSTTGPDGPHTTGRAVDIRVAGSDAEALLVLVCGSADGKGVHQTGA